MTSNFDGEQDLEFQRRLDLILERSDRTMSLGYGVLGSSKRATEDYEIIFDATTIQEKKVTKHIWIERSPKQNYYLNATINGKKVTARHLGSRLKEPELLDFLVQIIQDYGLELEIAAHLYLRLPKSASKKLTNHFHSFSKIEILKSLKVKLGEKVIKSNSTFRFLVDLLTNANKETQRAWVKKLTYLISHEK